MVLSADSNGHSNILWYKVVRPCRPDDYSVPTSVRSVRTKPDRTQICWAAARLVDQRCSRPKDRKDASRTQQAVSLRDQN
jgi:hypothetical protein